MPDQERVALAIQEERVGRLLHTDIVSRSNQKLSCRLTTTNLLDLQHPVVFSEDVYAKTSFPITFQQNRVLFNGLKSYSIGMCLAVAVGEQRENTIQLDTDQEGVFAICMCKSIDTQSLAVGLGGTSYQAIVPGHNVIHVKVPQMYHYVGLAGARPSANSPAIDCRNIQFSEGRSLYPYSPYVEQFGHVGVNCLGKNLLRQLNDPWAER